MTLLTFYDLAFSTSVQEKKENYTQKMDTIMWKYFNFIAVDDSKLRDIFFLHDKHYKSLCKTTKSIEDSIYDNWYFRYHYDSSLGSLCIHDTQVHKIWENSYIVSFVSKYCDSLFPENLTKDEYELITKKIVFDLENLHFLNEEFNNIHSKLPFDLLHEYQINKNKSLFTDLNEFVKYLKDQFISNNYTIEKGKICRRLALNEDDVTAEQIIINCFFKITKMIKECIFTYIQNNHSDDDLSKIRLELLIDYYNDKVEGIKQSFKALNYMLPQNEEELKGFINKLNLENHDVPSSFYWIFLKIQSLNVINHIILQYNTRNFSSTKKNLILTTKNYPQYKEHTNSDFYKLLFNSQNFLNIFLDKKNPYKFFDWFKANEFRKHMYECLKILYDERIKDFETSEKIIQNIDAISNEKPIESFDDLKSVISQINKEIFLFQKKHVSDVYAFLLDTIVSSTLSNILIEVSNKWIENFNNDENVENNQYSKLILEGLFQNFNTNEVNFDNFVKDHYYEILVKSLNIYKIDYFLGQPKLLDKNCCWVNYFRFWVEFKRKNHDN